MKRVLLSWSSGKDSAWALHLLRQQEEYDVVGLFTTLNQAFDRIAMHGVRRVLLEAQAQALGLPLQMIPIPWPCSNAEYERIMASFCLEARQSGIDAIAFGDLFLTDIRQYRETQLKGTGLEPLFPIWGLPTEALAQEMIAAGVRAKLTCVDPKRLASGFAGRDFDEALLGDLPEGVDPCGENGEFHSFVYAGPMFQCPLGIQAGEITERDGFVFADLLPGFPLLGSAP
ncbi:MAG: ATP-binding protein [Acidobacteria bacterium]|nr:MAG: ATP-binding protein [Acidobacteriota bacterium]